MLLNEKATSPVNVSRYYFYRLNDEQKGLYGAISKGIKALQAEIKIPLKPINEVSMIIESILLDNPMIFYTRSQTYTSDLNKGKMLVRPDYKYDKAFTSDSVDQIKIFLKAFNSMKLKSDIEKEKYVHDFCLDHYTYDHSFSDYSYSILGPVINKTAVCEGISKFVKLALGYLVVDCTVVVGKAKNPRDDSDSNECHMWNIVTINGKKYHLDVTFDMTIGGSIKRYDYFNLSDTNIKKDHTITNPVPACVTSGEDYYTVNSCVVNNPAELEKYIAEKIRLGNKNIVVKLLRVPDNANVVEKVGNIATQQYVNIRNKSVKVDFLYNPEQLVFEINYK